MAETKTKGKQKIEMRKVENDEDRMTTFSKRKSGIYKKMNELVTMCDVETMFLAFTGSGTPFTFAHPSMETVAYRFMNPHHQLVPKDNAQLATEAYKKQCINQLIREYEKLEEELDMEKRRERLLEKSMKEMESNKYWWKTPIHELKEDELHKTYNAFMELYNSLCDLISERMRLIGDDSSTGAKP